MTAKRIAVVAAVIAIRTITARTTNAMHTITARPVFFVVVTFFQNLSPPPSLTTDYRYMGTEKGF